MRLTRFVLAIAIFAAFAVTAWAKYDAASHKLTFAERWAPVDEAQHSGDFHQR
jgi:hypothetical protein